MSAVPVFCRFHKRPQLVRILSQMNPLHALKHFLTPILTESLHVSHVFQRAYHELICVR